MFWIITQFVWPIKAKTPAASCQGKIILLVLKISRTWMIDFIRNEQRKELRERTHALWSMRELLAPALSKTFARKLVLTSTLRGKNKNFAVRSRIISLNMKNRVPKLTIFSWNFFLLQMYFMYIEGLLVQSSSENQLARPDLKINTRTNFTGETDSQNLSG